MLPLIICFEILESLLKISIKLLFFWELCNQYTNQPCDLLLSAILNWFTRVNTRVCNPLCVSYIQPQPSKALVCCHFSDQLIMAQQAKCICSNCNSTNSEEGWKETNVDGNTDEVDRSAQLLLNLHHISSYKSPLKADPWLWNTRLLSGWSSCCLSSTPSTACSTFGFTLSTSVRWWHILSSPAQKI